jgi:ferritin
MTNMIGKKIEAAFNKQINEELFSAYLYLSMSAQFETLNLGGFAHWMRVQAQEETSHAMKFYNLYEAARLLAAIAALKPNGTAAGDDRSGKARTEDHRPDYGLADLPRRKTSAAALSSSGSSTQVEEEKHADEIVQTSSRLLCRGNALRQPDPKVAIDSR